MTSSSDVALVLDAAAASGSVAVMVDGHVVAEAEAVMRSGDREFLLPAAQGALAKARLSVGDLTRVVCGSGPGSFTSLRIAGSVAKGIAHARGVPLFAVPSLGLLVAARERPAGRYLAAINALRGEHYVAEFTVGDDGRVRGGDEFELVASESLSALAASRNAVLAGGTPGEDSQPHARGASRLDAVQVDLATWEPNYGRLAEAQVRWEAAHGRPLGAQ